MARLEFGMENLAAHATPFRIILDLPHKAEADGPYGVLVKSMTSEPIDTSFPAAAAAREHFNYLAITWPARWVGGAIQMVNFGVPGVGIPATFTGYQRILWWRRHKCRLTAAGAEEFIHESAYSTLPTLAVGESLQFGQVGDGLGVVYHCCLEYELVKLDPEEWERILEKTSTYGVFSPP